MIIRNTSEIMLTQQPSQTGTRMWFISVSLILCRFILIVIIKESNIYAVIFLLFLVNMKWFKLVAFKLNPTRTGLTRSFIVRC